MQVADNQDFFPLPFFSPYTILCILIMLPCSTLNNFCFFSVFTLQILAVPGDVRLLHGGDLAGIQKMGNALQGNNKMQLL